MKRVLPHIRRQEPAGERKLPFETPVRGLDSWRDGSFAAEAGSHVVGLANDLDHILRSLTLSPTFRALSDYCPDIHNLQFQFDVAANQSFKDKQAVSADYWNDLVTLYYYIKKKLHLGCNVSTVGHEIRHRFHDSLGLFNIYSANPYHMIALTRAYEADSRVFGMLLAAEVAHHCGEDISLDDSIQADSVSLKFWNEVMRDKSLLYDDAFLTRFYETYFESFDAAYFDTYDDEVLDCHEARIDAGFRDFELDDNNFRDVVGEIFVMPYLLENEGGVSSLEDRIHYARLEAFMNPDYLTRHMNREIRERADSLMQCAVD